MAPKQKLSIRAYSFSFKKYRSWGSDKVYKLNNELRFPAPNDMEYVYSSAFDLFRDFIISNEQMDDKEGSQQLFRCTFDSSKEGETDVYRYLIFSVHSGYYGFPSDLIDRTTKQKVYRKTKDQADVKEFYVMVVIPKNSELASPTRGLIFFQEIGVYGIKTITATAMLIQRAMIILRRTSDATGVTGCVCGIKFAPKENGTAPKTFAQSL